MSSPISGFTAIPNPQMLAFMPIQSYLMMYFAGAGWQIGKRKVSAIPNDKFNPMTSTDLLKTFTADLRESIPELERSLQDITPLVEILIKQYGEFIKEIIDVTPEVAQNIAGGLVNPKGALVPPLFGPELEKIVTGNPTQAQFLAYAQILMKQLVADGKITLKPPAASTKTIRPFIGPEINPVTGEKSTFISALQKARDLPPAPHIKERRVSNVSLQSLRLTLKDLQFQIRRAAIKHKNALSAFNILPRSAGLKKRQAQAKVGITASTLQAHQQKLANFLKMHGSRL